MRAFYLRTTQQSLFIDALQRGDRCEDTLVADLGDGHVEVRLVGNLQQLLQLQFVGHQLTLSLHDVVLIVGALRGQLGQVGLRHLTHVHHLLSALLVLLGRLQRLLTHFHALIDIEYLGEYLCDALLDAVRCLAGLQVSLLLRYLVEFHGVGVTSSVPHGPLPAHRVRAVV